MWSLFSRDTLKDFPYEIMEEQYDLWGDRLLKLHRGKSKATGEIVSIFTYDIKLGNESTHETVRKLVKRLKTLRHPSILTYLDSHEHDSSIYLATEYVEPLLNNLTIYEDTASAKDMYYPWGIMQVFRAVSFLHDDANLRHNNIHSGAIFVNSAGEWKLGEVGYVTPTDAPYPVKTLIELKKYNPPDVKSNSCIWSLDSWGLGILIWEVYNGKMEKKSNLQLLNKIPKKLVHLYCELVNADPVARPRPSEVLKRGMQKGGFFQNDLIDSLIFLEEIHIKEKEAKIKFLQDVVPLIQRFPVNICRNKMLPQLLNAFEFGEAGVSVLVPLLKIGDLIRGPDYQKLITPCIIKLYASNDRATRCNLLKHMPDYISEMSPSIINQKLFPQIVHGFVDTNPTIRESTVKSIILLAPKLDHDNLNVEVLKHFARLQAKDEQDGIRTNTTVCLGKIAAYLHPNVRHRVLISAFIRALRDPFPPARAAGVLALVACQQYFTLESIAGKILPAMLPLTIDADPSVRETTFRATKGFLSKLEKVSEDPSLKAEMEIEVNSSSGEASGPAAWAQWAVTAITTKFVSRGADEVKATPAKITTESKGNILESNKAEINTTGHVCNVAEGKSSRAEDKAEIEDKVLDLLEPLETELDMITPSSDLGFNYNISLFEPFESSGDGWVIEDSPILEETPQVKEVSKVVKQRSSLNNKRRDNDQPRKQHGPMKLGTKIS